MTTTALSEIRMNVAATVSVFALAFLNVAAAPHVATYEGLTLPESFSITADIDGSNGFIAGHPGRASLEVVDGDVVFTMGGDEAIAGICGDATSIRAALTPGSASVAATYGANGEIELMVEQASVSQIVVGAYDPASLEQLSMLEALVGGVACSANFYVGDADEACMVTPFDGAVSNVTVADTTPAERIAAR